MIKRLILFAHALAGLCLGQLTTEQRLTISPPASPSPTPLTNGNAG